MKSAVKVIQLTNSKLSANSGRSTIESGQGGLWMPFRQWTMRLCVGGLLGLVNGMISFLEWCTRFERNGGMPKQILVLRTAALGDFILSFPAMHRLRADFPTAKITLLTTTSTNRKTLKTVESYSEGQSPWLELLPEKLIDEVLVFSGHLPWNILKWKPAALQGKKFDVCFILNEGIGPALSGSFKKILFLRACGIRCRIFGIRARAYPKLFPLVQVGTHQLEHHVLALIRSVEECQQVTRHSDPVVRFDLHIPQTARDWAHALLRKYGCGTAEVVVISPGSRLEFKKWPVSGYIELIATLLDRPRTHVFLVGSGPEISTVSQVTAGCAGMTHSERLHDLSGQTSVVQLAALLSMAAVFVGNDGGTCHLAAAVGTKTVSISNGGEIPDSVEPWGNQRFTARNAVPCAPCYCFTYCPMKNNRCVTGITPKLVINLVGQALLSDRA